MFSLSQHGSLIKPVVELPGLLVCHPENTTKTIAVQTLSIKRVQIFVLIFVFDSDMYLGFISYFQARRKKFDIGGAQILAVFNFSFWLNRYCFGTVTKLDRKKEMLSL